MGWLVFWTLLAVGCIWGMLNAFADSFEETVCQPIYENLSKQGRKTLAAFFFISFAVNIPLRIMTRLIMWVGLYAIVTFAGYSPSVAYKLIGVFVAAAALQHTAELIKEYYPTKHTYLNRTQRWVKRHIPEKYQMPDEYL